MCRGRGAILWLSYVSTGSAGSGKFEILGVSNPSSVVSQYFREIEVESHLLLLVGS